MSGEEAVLRAQDAAELNDEYKVYIVDYLMPDMKVGYLSLMVVQMILLLNRFIRRGKLEIMESMWVVEMLN